MVEFGHLTAPKPKARVAVAKCQECGKLFYTVEAAKRAAFGDDGCPKCGGSDIDIC